MKSKMSKTARWLRLHSVYYGFALATLCLAMAPYFIKPTGADAWPTP